MSSRIRMHSFDNQKELMEKENQVIEEETELTINSSLKVFKDFFTIKKLNKYKKEASILKKQFNNKQKEYYRIIEIENIFNLMLKKLNKDDARTN